MCGRCRGVFTVQVLVAVKSRWPLYLGGRHCELVVGVLEEGVLGGCYTYVTVIERWPLRRGCRCLKLIAGLLGESVLGGRYTVVTK